MNWNHNHGIFFPENYFTLLRLKYEIYFFKVQKNNFLVFFSLDKHSTFITHRVYYCNLLEVLHVPGTMNVFLYGQLCVYESFCVSEILKGHQG